jgi:hypothetical protein
MPAKLVFGAVAVVANARAQLTDLGDQLVTRHLLEIVVHRLSLGHGKPIRQDHRRVPRSSAHKRTPASHLGSRVVGWLTPQPQPRRVARDRNGRLPPLAMSQLATAQQNQRNEQARHCAQPGRAGREAATAAAVAGALMSRELRVLPCGAAAVIRRRP